MERKECRRKSGMEQPETAKLPMASSSSEQLCYFSAVRKLNSFSFKPYTLKLETVMVLLAQDLQNPSWHDLTKRIKGKN